jgi:predicted DNA-binding transcriptional regulator AlpA
MWSETVVDRKSPRSQAELSKLSDACLISDGEVATLLGVSKWTLWRMDARGEGPPKIKLSTQRSGRSIGGVREWIKQREKASEAAGRRPRRSDARVADS